MARASVLHVHPWRNGRPCVAWMLSECSWSAASLIGDDALDGAAIQRQRAKLRCSIRLVAEAQVALVQESPGHRRCMRYVSAENAMVPQWLTTPPAGP